MSERVSLKIPISTKIFVVLTLVIGAAVGSVTASAVSSFREDKSAYVFDLTSQVAQNTAADLRRSLTQLSEKMHLFAAVLDAPNVAPVEKSELLKSFFKEFPGVLMLTIYEGGKSRIQVINPTKMERHGVTKEQLLERRAAAGIPTSGLEAGSLVLENTTLNPARPTLTLALPMNEDPNQVMVAELDQARVISLGAFGGEQRYTTWIADGRGRLVVHPDVERARKGEDMSGLRIVQTMLSAGGVSATQAFVDDTGEEMLGAFAPVGRGGLGVIVQVPEARAFDASQAVVRSAVISALAVIVLALLIGLLFARTLTRPIERLSEATEYIAQGHFDADVTVDARDEIGDLAGSIRTMTRGLKKRDEELRNAQSQLIQSEKMAAFGQMSAGIAHEVKNPLAGILGSAQLAKVFYPKGKDIEKFLVTIEKEAKRCRDIVDNLLRFARQEKAEQGIVDLNEVAESTVTLVTHQIGIKQIALGSELAEGKLRARGNANQLQQVLMNLLLNAQDAIDLSRPEQAPEGGDGRRGHVTVRTERRSDGLFLMVEDDGPGVPPELRERIFEPFFTTKPVGRGTGLGLSVSYGIIKDAGGAIWVEPRDGGGTAFHIRLLPADGAAPEAGAPRAAAS